MTFRQAVWGKLASLALLAAGALPASAQPRVDPNITPTSIQGSGAKPAAVVNGEPISMTDLKQILDARPDPTPLTAEQQKAKTQVALEMLVDDLLMKQYLRKAVPQVDSAEYQKDVQELQEGLKKLNKSLPQFLKENGQSEQQLQAEIVARVQWRTLLRRECPEATVRKYYDENKYFFDKVIVRASHIMFKVGSDAKQEQRQLAAQKLQVIRQEILAGKIDFAVAAQKYSDCESSKKTGGDIGPFPYKFVVYDSIARCAFAMKPGQISDVVHTDYGVHLIKVTDRSAGEPSNYETMRDMVREVWAQENELGQRILAAQRKASAIEVNVR
jgi:peptidyl-prolyl cis-trans isomerase C